MYTYVYPFKDVHTPLHIIHAHDIMETLVVHGIQQGH